MSEDLEQEAKRLYRLAEGFRQDYANSNRKREELEGRLADMVDLLRQCSKVITDAHGFFINGKWYDAGIINKRIDAAIRAAEQ